MRYLDFVFAASYKQFVEKMYNLLEKMYSISAQIITQFLENLYKKKF